MVHAIEAGFVQKEIQDAAYKYQREIENEERIIVGVNKFTVQNETTKKVLKVDPTLRKVQSEKLAKLRQERDNKKVHQTLQQLKEKSKDSKINLIPFIIEAAKNYATLGEICNVLRDEFGEYQESIVL